MASNAASTPSGSLARLKATTDSPTLVAVARASQRVGAPKKAGVIAPKKPGVIAPKKPGVMRNVAQNNIK
jgi:hypothetical protein